MKYLSGIEAGWCGWRVGRVLYIKTDFPAFYWGQATANRVIWRFYWLTPFSAIEDPVETEVRKKPTPCPKLIDLPTASVLVYKRESANHIVTPSDILYQGNLRNLIRKTVQFEPDTVVNIRIRYASSVGAIVPIETQVYVNLEGVLDLSDIQPIWDIF